MPDPNDTTSTTQATTTEEAKFSQADVDRIVKERLKKVSDYDAIRAQAEKAQALEAELSKLREEAELAGKTEIEKARAIAARTQERYERELAEERKRAAELEAKTNAIAQRLRDTNVGHQVTGALVGAKVFSGAMNDAMATFIRETEIETDENHAVLGVTFAGARFTSLDDAAKAFLKAKPYFASAVVASGSGARGGPVLGAGRALADLPDSELAAMVPIPRTTRN